MEDLKEQFPAYNSVLRQSNGQQRPYHSTGLPDCPPNGAGIPGMVMIGRKSGPAVPPKPRKNGQQQVVPPQVPKSSNVKQYCEPSFSTVLEGQASNLDEHAYTNVSNNGGNATRGGGGKLAARKVTLDDALELQHVKEALEHHKRTLDANRSKSLQGQGGGEHGSTVYENTQPTPYGDGYASDATYSNLPGGGGGGAPAHAKNNEGLIGGEGHRAGGC